MSELDIQARVSQGAVPIRRWAELTADDFARLDRARTAALVTFSPIEVHGPHLPVVADVLEGDTMLLRTVEKVRELGRGATLLVFLPAEEGRAPRREPAAVEDVPTGSETILVVDDETPVLAATRLLLRDLGYDVITASSGQEALDILNTPSKRVDLVVLDMVMPKLSGADVYERIRSLGLDVKVLLSSGYSIDGEATRLLAEGCEGFLQKPYPVKVLANKVRQVLDKPSLDNPSLDNPSLDDPQAESTKSRTAT